jgi:hypothetical protein
MDFSGEQGQINLIQNLYSTKGFTDAAKLQNGLVIVHFISPRSRSGREGFAIIAVTFLNVCRALTRDRGPFGRSTFTGIYKVGSTDCCGDPSLPLLID